MERVSPSNIESARNAFRAFEQRDMNALKQLCTPDVEFDWSRRLLDPSTTRGYDGIQRFLEEMEAIFDEIVFEQEEILELGNEVLMISTGRFRGRTSGVDVTAHGANVLTIRDGKLARFRFYQTKEDALEDLASEGAGVAAEPSTPAP